MRDQVGFIIAATTPIIPRRSYNLTGIFEALYLYQRCCKEDLYYYKCEEYEIISLVLDGVHIKRKYSLLNLAFRFKPTSEALAVIPL